MDFQEFPKALYKGEELAIVETADQEQAKRADGFRFWSDPEPEADPSESDASGHTVESVRAQLDAAGIAYDKRLGLSKLIALLPA